MSQFNWRYPCILTGLVCNQKLIARNIRFICVQKFLYKFSLATCIIIEILILPIIPLEMIDSQYLNLENLWIRIQYTKGILIYLHITNAFVNNNAFKEKRK